APRPPPPASRPRRILGSGRVCPGEGRGPIGESRGGVSGCAGSVLLAADQDLALAGVVGLADDALALHALDQRRRLVVADGEAALDIGGGGLLVAEDDVDGLVVEFVARGVAEFLAAGVGRIELLLLGGDGIEIVGGALRLQMA